jgi:CBS domain-containing protein
MRRWLYHFCYVHGDFEHLDEVLRRDLREILRAATGMPDEPPAGDGSFVMSLRVPVLGAHVDADMRVTTGVATYRTGCLTIPVQWRGDQHPHVLPDFDGRLELQPDSRSQAALILAGSSRTPMGPLGAFVDSVLINGLTPRSLAQLVHAVGEELENRASGRAPTASTGSTNGLLRVRDVMSSNPIVLEESATLVQAARVLFTHDISGAPVVSGSGDLVGMLTERDLLEKEAPAPEGFGRATRQAQHRHDALTVGQACTRPAITTSPDAMLRSAAELMREQRVGRLVVVDGAEIAGIVSRHDVLKALLRPDEELLDAVQQALSSAGLDHVGAIVSHGEVTLTGVFASRSKADDTVRRVAQVDGVMAVDDRLYWSYDDVVTLSYP